MPRVKSFFHVILHGENPQVLPFILRMTLKVNPRIFMAQGHSTIGLKDITTIYLLRAQNVTCEN
jgi:hypothetical protein